MRLIAQPFFNMKMSFICMEMKNDLHIKGYPRFETGALWNSEMAYSHTNSL